MAVLAIRAVNPADGHWQVLFQQQASNAVKWCRSLTVSLTIANIEKTKSDEF
jgi:hypothetical protein